MQPSEKFKTVLQFKNALSEIIENPDSKKYSEAEKKYLLEAQGETQKALISVLKPVQEQAEKFKKVFSKVFDDLSKQFEISTESQNQLVFQNWYLPFWDLEIGFFNSLSSCIKSSNVAMIDQVLVNYYRKEFDSLSKDILDTFPKRNLPLESAFKAHKNGEYYLSIPVFFCQIEGIFEDAIRVRFFSTRKKGDKHEPKYRRNIEEMISSDIMEKVFFPIIEVREANRIQVPGYPSGLNRHDVLHGTSVDYGTELNSFKVFSLLVFIVNVIHKYR